MTEIRTVSYDEELEIEAYHFKGIMQSFPNHFHAYYVIGFIEQGLRYLNCNNTEYTINSGDIIIFNPNEPHTCKQIDGRTLDYRCINIQPKIMAKLVYGITGKEYLPNFKETVIYKSDVIPLIRELHNRIMEGDRGFRKEELLFFLVKQLLEENTEPVLYDEIKEPNNNTTSVEVNAVCNYIAENYAKNISLEQLSSLVGLSKYYFIRYFTKEKGISPYNYLSAIRIENAKKMLESGVNPIDVAFQTGYSDQSHFTNYFKKLIGLTPKQYMRIFIK